jgi:carboxyl-terminal processing protease
MIKIAMTFISLIIFIAVAVQAQSNGLEAANLRKASLDTIWQTVHEYHYDTTFGGVDWDEIHNRYAESTAVAKDDTAFIKLMNKMLLELKLSHYSVFQKEKEANSGSPLFSEASLGLDLRLLDNEVVISSLDPEFPAGRAGMKPGYAIKSINGIAVQQILGDAAARHVPHFNERHKVRSICNAVIKKCFGQTGDTAKIGYEDESGNSRDATLPMKQRPGGVKMAEEFPTVFVDFRSERLADSIGYIYFGAFVPPVDSLFLSAIETMQNLRGLIIDIRGNPGGDHEIGETIASKLLSEKTLFSVFRYRDSTVQVSVDPDPPIFKGPIVILIDVMNASASERFSACMQSIGRAEIIGEQSPGAVGPSSLKELPNGATFLYLVAQSLTPDGKVLEGNGVVPDITVPLDRKALLNGTDTQIEQAIKYLKSI